MSSIERIGNSIVATVGRTVVGVSLSVGPPVWWLPHVERSEQVRAGGRLRQVGAGWLLVGLFVTWGTAQADNP